MNPEEETKGITEGETGIIGGPRDEPEEEQVEQSGGADGGDDDGSTEG